MNVYRLEEFLKNDNNWRILNVVKVARLAKFFAFLCDVIRVNRRKLLNNYSFYKMYTCDHLSGHIM